MIAILRLVKKKAPEGAFSVVREDIFIRLTSLLLNLPRFRFFFLFLPYNR